jgi:predicted Zn-dependent protease with MMP-like domain
MTDSVAPSIADFEVLAARAYESIPDALRTPLDGLAIRIVDLPDAATCDALDLASPFDLLGLYHGRSLDRKSVQDVGSGVDIVFLYREPILDYWRWSGEPLADIVRHVLIHEIGHHFGFSDEEMDAIESR